MGQQKTSQELLNSTLDNNGTIVALLQQSMGATSGGGAIIASTDYYGSLSCYALHAITDTVIDTMLLNSSFSGSLDGATVKAGDTVLISFSAIQLTSGTCVIYKA